MTPASPSLKSWFGMIPILAWPGDASPGQLGPMTTQPRLRARGITSRQSWNGIRSVMMTTSFSPASIASIAASFAYAAGTKIIEALARLRWTASRTPSKTGTPSTFVPPLPGVTPATTFVPKSSIARVWNWPWWPVIPWTTTRLFFVRSTAISGGSSSRLDREFRGLFDRLGREHPDTSEDLLRLVLIHSLDPSDDRDLRVHDVDRLLHPEGHRVRFRDPPEDVEQDRRGLRLQEQLERLCDFRRIVGTAEVEECAAFPAFQVQDVQGGHRQARPVRDHADIPVELDERDALRVGFLLERRSILVQRRVFRMTVFRVVVDHELRIAGDNPPVARHRERIDLDELCVFVAEEVVRVPCHVDDLVPNFLREGELAQEGPPDVRLGPDEDGHMLHEDLLVRDGLDLHAAERARHEEGLPRGPIDRIGKVQLPADVEPLLQVHLLDRVPADVHPEDLARDRPGFIERVRGPDASGLASAADEHLGLHHAREGRVDDVFGPRGDDAAGDRNAVAGEDLLRLVLEEFHFAARPGDAEGLL